jgi:hypothetical protein
MDKSSSFGMSPGPFKKYPRSTSVKAWGCPRHPLFINKKHQVIFQHAIFLFLHVICVILGAYLLFVVCLLSIKLDPIIHVYFGVRHAPPLCIFTLEWDTLRCFACLFWSETRSTVMHFALERDTLHFYIYLSFNSSLDIYLFFIYESCLVSFGWRWKHEKSFMCMWCKWKHF